ncbi:MAG TPA: CopD family protein [Thermodesulfobacteriota bacterium]
MDTRLVLVFVHVLTAAVWYGGLMVAMVAIRAARGAGSPASGVAVVRRYQRVAWIALVVLLATGIYNVVPWVPMLQSGGGMQRFMWTLTAKVALFGAVVAVTAAQQWLHVRALGAGETKAFDGYLALARVNLLLGAIVLFLGVSLTVRGGLG